ncbi:MAG: MATE family efflux transporter [Alphaproteobacteria bacterium]
MTTAAAPDLGKDSIPRLLLTFAIPAIVGLMINALYNIVDRIFVGNGVGAMGLAGIAVSFPSFIIMMAFGMMVGVGGSVNFAIRLGQGKVAVAERILANSLVLIVILTVILVAVQLAFLEDVLRFFGATETIMPYAKSYVGITLLGSIFLTANMTMNNFIRASGFPRIAMGTMIIGAISNTILDPIFIFVLDMGIGGAAIATVISQMFSCTWAASFFISKRSPYRVRMKNLPLNSRTIRAILSIGFAPFSIQIASGFMQTILNKALVVHGGDLAISAMGVATSTIIFLFMPVMGLCEGSQPLIGFNFGAQNFKRVRRIYRLTSLVATVIMTVSWIFLRFYADNVIALFDPNDSQLIEMGGRALKTMTLVIPLVGVQIATTVFLQATKCPRLAALLALSRQLIFLIPCLIILPDYFGLRGVFYALPVSDFFSFLLVIFVLFGQFRKYRRLEQEKMLSPESYA